MQIIFNLVRVLAAHRTSIFNFPFKKSKNSYIKIGKIVTNSIIENTGVTIDKIDKISSETKKKVEYELYLETNSYIPILPS